MAHSHIAYGVVALLVLASACRPESTVTPLASPMQTPLATAYPSATAAPSATLAPSPAPTGTPTATITPIHTPTSSPTPGASWQTYVLTAGVSVEYPSTWFVANPTHDAYIDSVRFSPVTQEGPLGVLFEVYPRSIKDRKIVDPHSWEPNEGGYLVQWEKPITIEHATGLLFVWGVKEGEQLRGASLMAIYYSAEYQLDIRLITNMDSSSLASAHTIGLTDTIKSQYGYFEHMAQSILISR